MGVFDRPPDNVFIVPDGSLHAGRVWFTSDTHFGHANIIRLADRPFRDVVHMNEMLVHNWNERVAPEDTIYHLGDVALGSIEESLGYISRLSGRKVLVTGNHDRNFRGMKRSRGLEPEQWDAVYQEAGFEVVAPSMSLYRVAGLPTVQLSHFPYAGDSHGEDRHTEFRPQNQGIPLIHGHTHSHGDPLSFDEIKRKIPLLDENGKQVKLDKDGKPDGKGKPQFIEAGVKVPQVHVGVDAWDYRPVSSDEVLELLS